MLVYFNLTGRIEFSYVKIIQKKDRIMESFCGSYSDDPNEYYDVEYYIIVLTQKEFAKIAKISELQHLLYIDRDAEGNPIYLLHCEPPYIDQDEVKHLYYIQDAKPPCSIK